MAIATLNKVSLAVPKTERERVLRLLQAFQNLEIIPHPRDGDEAAFVPAEAEREEIQNALSEITRAQSLLSVWHSVSALEKYRKGRPEMTLSDLEETVARSRWQEICEKALELERDLEAVRARRGELYRLIETWSPWRSLAFSPKEASKAFRYTRVLAGSFPTRLYPAFVAAFIEAAAGRGVIEELFETSDRVGVLLFCPAGAAEAEEAVRRHDFAELDFPFEDTPQATLEAWESEEKALAEREADLLQQLKELGEQKPVLDLAEEFYHTLLLRDEARQLAYQSKSIFYLEGWIDAEHREALQSLLRREITAPYFVSFSEVAEEEAPHAPTKLKNSKFIAAFETLTEMFSMPVYGSVDPTSVTTIFYLVFFGMMVADVGYGLLLLVATFLARKFLKLERGLARSIDFFFFLSFPIIAWGLVYGSFFGLDLPFALLSPMRDIISILILSIVFGWIQLFTAQIISVYASLRKKDIFGAISGGGVWALLLLGLGLLVVSKLVIKNNGLFYAAAAMCAVAALGIVVLPAVESKRNRFKGLLKGLYALYGVTGYIGDLVSYSRLMALGMAGASISVAFNTIIGSIPFIARVTLGILVAAAMHLLNLFLSMLGAYVHGLRLQYVEFFGKFYEGGGRKFTPFKAAEKHIYLIEEHVKDAQPPEPAPRSAVR